MKDKIKIIVLIIIFISLLFVSNNILINPKDLNINKIDNNTNNIKKSGSSVEQQNNLSKENEINVLEESNMNEQVLEIGSENFQKEVLESDKKVLVDFYADWCGPCKRLSPIIEEIAGEEEQVKFVKLNIDDAQDIAIEYQVMSIPTLVIFENGKEVNRSVGLIDKEKLKELIK